MATGYTRRNYSASDYMMEGTSLLAKTILAHIKNVSEDLFNEITVWDTIYKNDTRTVTLKMHSTVDVCTISENQKLFKSEIRWGLQDKAKLDLGTSVYGEFKKIAMMKSKEPLVLTVPEKKEEALEKEEVAKEPVVEIEDPEPESTTEPASVFDPDPIDFTEEDWETLPSEPEVAVPATECNPYELHGIEKKMDPCKYMTISYEEFMSLPCIEPFQKAYNLLKDLYERSFGQLEIRYKIYTKGRLSRYLSIMNRSNLMLFNMKLTPDGQITIYEEVKALDENMRELLEDTVETGRRAFTPFTKYYKDPLGAIIRTHFNTYDDVCLALNTIYIMKQSKGYLFPDKRTFANEKKV